jgi:hypothetical protein
MRAQYFETKWQQGGASAVGEIAEVADADEAFGEQMQEKASQKLLVREVHAFTFVVVSRIPPTKSALPLRKRDKAMVGDGHAMGVTAQILEHMLGASEGWFAINHPVLSKQGSKPGSKDLRLGQERQIAREVELIVLESVLEAGYELAAEYTSKHMNREKEARTGSDPVGVIE